MNAIADSIIGSNAVIIITDAEGQVMLFKPYSPDKQLVDGTFDHGDNGVHVQSGSVRITVTSTKGHKSTLIATSSWIRQQVKVMKGHQGYIASINLLLNDRAFSYIDDYIYTITDPDMILSLFSE